MDESSTALSDLLKRELFPGVSQDTKGPPYYLHDYPCFRKVQLGAVKRGIFHPRLPTLRAMDMDDVKGRLPDEHCRGTTTCTAQDFALATASAFPPLENRLHCLDITDTGRNLRKHFITSADVKEANDVWQRSIENTTFEPICVGKKKFPKPTETPSDKWTWDGVSVRLRRPEHRYWRFTFRQEPILTGGPCQRSQQPTPALSNARHRRDVW